MDIQDIGLENYFKDEKMLNVVGVTDVVQAGAIVATTVSEIQQAEKRAQFQRAFDRLSASEQIALAKQLQKNQSKEARLKIITDAVNLYNIQQEKNKNVQTGLIIGGSLVLLIAIVFLVKD